MADILKITTPLVNKNQQVQLKPGIDPSSPFQLHDITRVPQTQNQGEILQQNNGLINQGDNAALLENLLKDPSVTAAYLKNIFMLEELIKLLPANNKTVTDEIETMFQTLLVDAKDIAAEMKHQEASSTAFRGELFNLLRNVSKQHSPQSETQSVIANLLRALNHVVGNKDIRDAVANSLQYLAKNMNSSKSLFPKLETLARLFRAPDSEQHFNQLKRETLDILQQVRESVLFSPKLEKVVSITIYNLSRHNSNQDYLHESSAALWRLLEPQTRQEFQQALTSFLNRVTDRDGSQAKTSSKVMETLVDLVTTQAKSDNNTAEQARIEKIIHSLLSSPCNFTPLLHFVIPVEFLDLRSFAEIWINPNSEDEENQGQVKREHGIHILLVIDVETVGRFEAELYVHDNKTINLSIFCPIGFQEPYRNIGRSLSKILKSTSYRLEDVRVEPLDRSRSLMEVFKTLPYRRVGVDVKV